MNVTRAIVDVNELARALRERSHTEIESDLEATRTVTISKLDYPSGWEASDGSTEIAVRFTLPPSYPAHPPTVSIPSDLRYNGQYTVSMAPPEHTAETAEWRPFDADIEEWNPRTSSLLTLFTTVESQLHSPRLRD